MTPDKKDATDEGNHAEHLACVVDEITKHTASGNLFNWDPDENGKISKVFNYAFKYGGLDEVDELIEDINGLLLAKGAEFILKSGAACLMDADGAPDSLMLYYQKPGGGNPVCNQWITIERN
ncbi:MAG: hypothetical protein C5B53_00695 [Candidatus Melainabacteria bacterium]|nr:MAG: hypothetical protein C5B53_00695 [Candidatus Melainabacteria bacterium]